MSSLGYSEASRTGLQGQVRNIGQTFGLGFELRQEPIAGWQALGALVGLQEPTLSLLTAHLLVPTAQGDVFAARPRHSACQRREPTVIPEDQSPKIFPRTR
jgi:hypothetical protein